MNKSLGRKVINGVGWTFGSSVMVRLIQLLATVVLARLLAPAQFGLFAMGSIVITAIMLFRDLGLGEALLYYKTDLKENADTTFVMSFAFGLGAWAVLYGAAPFASGAFGDKDIIWPLRIMGCAVFLSSLSLVPAALLERELEFRKRAVPEVAMGLSHAMVSVGLAWAGCGVWSLVAGYVVSTAVFTVAAWHLAGWSPSLSYNRESARRILAFGTPLMASSVLLLAFFYTDQAAVGRWLGAAVLGCYSMAFTICHLPATNITFTVNRVMYPAYSKMNDDIPAVRKAYTQSIRMIALLTFPIALWTCVMSHDFVTGFLGDKWRQAVPLIHVLAFYGLFRSIGSTADSVFMATGKTKLISRVNFLQLAIVLPLVYPAADRYGAIGVAALYTAAYLAGSCFALWNVIRILAMPARAFLGIFKLPLILSVVAVSAAFGLSRLLPSGSIAAVGAALFAMILYIPITGMFDKGAISTIRWILENR